jgi:hypothetical protein
MKLNEKKQSILSQDWQDLQKILDYGDKEEIRALFAFDSSSVANHILFQFKIWGAYFYPQYFVVADAPFHNDIDKNNLAIYRGEIDSFVDGAFRGAAKTTRTKLFFAFAIANDIEHSKKYIKIATKDIANAKQIVTDIYNHLAVGDVRFFYPEIFAKTPEKRQETMGIFTTATGVMVRATTVGVEQRGQLQEESRPDIIWCDDFETRNTLRSAVVTQMLWDNLEEARTGLSIGGGIIYTCNYVSERGNVHKLVQPAPGRVIMLTPIITKENVITWPAKYTMADIERLRNAPDTDFAGEYLNEPSAGADVYFDRSTLDRQIKKVPVKEIAGLKIFHEYNASHRYGSGADTAGGVGLDSSADVIIDFTTIPARVAATFASNTISPDVFGFELINHGNRFGECIIGVENNKYDSVIRVLKEKDYPNIYFTEVDETRVGLPPKTRRYGWNTNSATKYTMLTELKTAVEDGLLELSDPALIAELRSYTRDDLMDRDEDVRLTTRHFDLLIALAIAWQMRKWSVVSKPKTSGYQQPAYERTGLE